MPTAPFQHTNATNTAVAPCNLNIIVLGLQSSGRLGMQTKGPLPNDFSSQASPQHIDTQRTLSKSGWCSWIAEVGHASRNHDRARGVRRAGKGTTQQSIKKILGNGCFRREGGTSSSPIISLHFFAKSNFHTHTSPPHTLAIAIYAKHRPTQEFAACFDINRHWTSTAAARGRVLLHNLRANFAQKSAKTRKEQDPSRADRPK